MKTKVLLLFCMIISVIALGQNQKVEEMKNVLEKSEVEVTPPKFTGIENVASILDADNSIVVNDFLFERVNYPKEAIKRWKEGTEVVQFVVTPSGKVTDFKVINSVSPEIDKELIRVLKTTNGMWEPGSNNGNPVAMKKEISMVFAVKGVYRNSVEDRFTKNATNYFNKGNKKLIFKHNPKKALEHYTEGIKYLPRDKALLVMRGICRYELGDKDGARSDWNRSERFGGIDPSEFAFDLTKQKGYQELTSMLLKEK